MGRAVLVLAFFVCSLCTWLSCLCYYLFTAQSVVVPSSPQKAAQMSQLWTGDEVPAFVQKRDTRQPLFAPKGANFGVERTKKTTLKESMTMQRRRHKGRSRKKKTIAIKRVKGKKVRTSAKTGKGKEQIRIVRRRNQLQIVHHRGTAHGASKMGPIILIRRHHHAVARKSAPRTTKRTMKRTTKRKQKRVKKGKNRTKNNARLVRLEGNGGREVPRVVERTTGGIWPKRENDMPTEKEQEDLQEEEDLRSISYEGEVKEVEIEVEEEHPPGGGEDYEGEVEHGDDYEGEVEHGEGEQELAELAEWTGKGHRVEEEEEEEGDVPLSRSSEPGGVGAGGEEVFPSAEAREWGRKSPFGRHKPKWDEMSKGAKVENSHGGEMEDDDPSSEEEEEGHVRGTSNWKWKAGKPRIGTEWRANPVRRRSGSAEIKSAETRKMTESEIEEMGGSAPDGRISSSDGIRSRTAPFGTKSGPNIGDGTARNGLKMEEVSSKNKSREEAAADTGMKMHQTNQGGHSWMNGSEAGSEEWHPDGSRSHGGMLHRHTSEEDGSESSEEEREENRMRRLHRPEEQWNRTVGEEEGESNEKLARTRQQTVEEMQRQLSDGTENAHGQRENGNGAGGGMGNSSWGNTLHQNGGIEQAANEDVEHGHEKGEERGAEATGERVPHVPSEKAELARRRDREEGATFKGNAASARAKERWKNAGEALRDMLRRRVDEEEKGTREQRTGNGTKAVGERAKERWKGAGMKIGQMLAEKRKNEEQEERRKMEEDEERKEREEERNEMEERREKVKERRKGGSGRKIGQALTDERKRKQEEEHRKEEENREKAKRRWRGAGQKVRQMVREEQKRKKMEEEEKKTKKGKTRNRLKDVGEGSKKLLERVEGQNGSTTSSRKSGNRPEPEEKRTDEEERKRPEPEEKKGDEEKRKVKEIKARRLEADIKEMEREATRWEGQHQDEAELEQWEKTANSLIRNKARLNGSKGSGKHELGGASVDQEEEESKKREREREERRRKMRQKEAFWKGVVDQNGQMGQRKVEQVKAQRLEADIAEMQREVKQQSGHTWGSSGEETGHTSGSDGAQRKTTANNSVLLVAVKTEEERMKKTKKPMGGNTATGRAKHAQRKRKMDTKPSIGTGGHIQKTVRSHSERGLWKKRSSRGQATTRNRAGKVPKQPTVRDRHGAGMHKNNVAKAQWPAHNSRGRRKRRVDT